MIRQVSLSNLLVLLRYKIPVVDDYCCRELSMLPITVSINCRFVRLPNRRQALVNGLWQYQRLTVDARELGGSTQQCRLPRHLGSSGYSMGPRLMKRGLCGTFFLELFANHVAFFVLSILFVRANVRSWWFLCLFVDFLWCSMWVWVWVTSLFRPVWATFSK